MVSDNIPVALNKNNIPEKFSVFCCIFWNIYVTFVFLIPAHSDMKFSELYQLLKEDGWYIKRTKKHHIFAHPRKEGLIMVGKHKSAEVPSGTLNGILKQAELK